MNSVNGNRGVVKSVRRFIIHKASTLRFDKCLQCFGGSGMYSMLPSNERQDSDTYLQSIMANSLYNVFTIVYYMFLSN